MVRLFEKPLPTRSWPAWTRYGCTLVVVLVALGIQLWLWPHLDGHPFLLFFVAIIASATLFNHGSSVLAVAASALAADWFFIDPVESLAIARNIVAWLLFIAIGIGIGVVVEAMHVAVHRLHEANERLAASEAEMDLLLREATHRTRNDLQMLGSLVELQMQALADPAARAALAATGARIRLLGRVQGRLRRTRAEPVVDIREFVGELCDDLRNTLLDLRPITLTVEVERHELAQQRAVPVGLIVNELLTNALKHAFPDGRSGTIAVAFRRAGERYVLEVRDDGVGMPTGMDGMRRGLGQRLVRAMVAQLHGSLAVDSDGGCVVTVDFPVEADGGG